MNNQTINELIEKYKLSEEEHTEVLELLKERLFLGESSSNNPSIMFVVGQPGCGKTTFINSQSFSQYIIINSDEYRHLIKYSNEILSQYPTSYAKLTNHDAHLWGDELFNYAIKNGYSVLREKAPIDYSLLDLIKIIPNSFNIIINVVISGNLESLLATRERYEKEMQISSSAKLSNIESHNKCYDLLPDFVSKCISLGVKVNFVVPFDNQYKIIPAEDNHLQILQSLREKSNEYACQTYEKRMNVIKQSMINRKASQEQFAELEKIEIIFHEMTGNCQNKKSKNKRVS